MPSASSYPTNIILLSLGLILCVHLYSQNYTSSRIAQILAFVFRSVIKKEEAGLILVLFYFVLWELGGR